MKATHYEHQTTVASPAGAMRGIFTQALWHHHSNREVNTKDDINSVFWSFFAIITALPFFGAIAFSMFFLAHWYFEIGAWLWFLLTGIIGGIASTLIVYGVLVMLGYVFVTVGAYIEKVRR